jgi:hypothetical protein
MIQLVLFSAPLPSFSMNVDLDILPNRFHGIEPLAVILVLYQNSVC